MFGGRNIAWILKATASGALFLLPVMAQDSATVGSPPSIRPADWLTIDIRAKIQLDFGGSKPDFDDNRKIFQTRRLRFGVSGTLFNDLDYSVRVETRKADPQFRDTFLRYRRLRSLQIQAGRFKIPFGLDQLTDSGELDFVYRSRIGSILAPGRDTGVMVSGEALEQNIDYAVGVFRHDGRNSEIEDFATTNEYLAGGKRTVAGRITVSPTSIVPPLAALGNIRIGAAATRSRMTTGLSSLAGVTVADQIFFARMFVGGTRLRHGAELSWRWKDLSLKSEFMAVREERLGQGTQGENLPALRTQGWYLSATQPLFGRLDNGNGGLIGSIVPGKQLGVFEATARYEEVRFGSDPAAGFLPSRSPRAAAVVPNDDRAWTFGINWYANRYVKFQFNTVHETLRDPARTPINGEHHYWTFVGRSQIYF